MPNYRPKVSVIVITYNQEHCIDRALSGVLHQRGDFELELIVANDASTDKTVACVRRWQKLYPEAVKLIDHKQNVGFQANYLSGFRAATGDYLCLCDGDDWWTDRSKLQRQVKYMESHPDCAITFHRVVNLYRPGRVKTLSNGDTATDTTIEQLSRSNYITNLSVMYRRTLIPAEELPDWLAEVSLPDYAYHILYGSRGYIHYMKRPMGVYLQSAAGAWSLSGEEHRLRMALDVRSRLMEHLGAGNAAYEGLRKAGADIVTALIDLARQQGDKDKERQLTELLGRMAPEIDAEALQQAISRRRRQANRARKTSLKSIIRSIYRRLTTIIPTPKPC